MKDFAIENLFCCPICKSSFIHEQGIFICTLCGEKFSKKGNIYDFRVEINARNRNQQDKYEQLIFKKEHSKWLTFIMEHLSPEEYKGILLDPHLKEIDEYMNKLTKKGVNVGQRYDTVISHHDSIQSLDVAIALKHAPNISKKAIAVDLGCGTLRVTKELLRKGFQKIIAIDLLFDLMLYGYEKFNNEDKKKVILIRADVRFLPLKESSIDSIFSLELFEHIDAPLIFFIDLKRILKKEGIAVITTWNASEIRNCKIMREKGKSYYENGFFYKFYNLKELEIMLKELNIDFVLKPYGFYLERRLLNILGDKFVKLFASIDSQLSFFLPRFLFHRLIFMFKKRKD